MTPVARPGHHGPVSDPDSTLSRGAAVFESMRSPTTGEEEADTAGAEDAPSADAPSEDSPAGDDTEPVDEDRSTETDSTASTGDDHADPVDSASRQTKAGPPTDDAESNDPIHAEIGGKQRDDESPLLVEGSEAEPNEARTGLEPGPPVARSPVMPADVQGGLPGAEALAPHTDSQEPDGNAGARDGASVPETNDPGKRDAAGHALPRILAVANQKGGVGKTTTAVNLGAALAEAGYRTLVVDLDPQGNASTGLGINIRDLHLSMYDVIIHEASIDDTIEATAMRNLFVAPASLDLAGAEIELVPAFSRELRLRHALAEVDEEYDYVLIDCPPSLGLLTVNGLAAAGEVVVPIQCEYYALEGLGQLLRNVALVQRNLNQQLEVSTFVCVMYDARTKLADQVVSEVRNHFGEKVCRIVVPRTVRLSEAPSYGQPILAFDPRSRGAIAYRELAREISGGARD